MEHTTGKSSFLRNILVRLLFFGVFLIVVRFAYVITITGESCNVSDFCFFSMPESFNFVIAGAGPGASAITSHNAVQSTVGGSKQPDLYTSKDWIKSVHFYSSVFQDLISEGYLSPESKSLCVETPNGQEVYALKEMGVSDAIGISKKASKPLVTKGEGHRMPFDDNTFDFVFSGGGRLDKSLQPSDFAAEIARTLKPEGLVVVHTKAKDTYSFNSFIDLFNCCQLVKWHDIDGFDSSMPYIREIVLRKQGDGYGRGVGKSDGNSDAKCSVPGHKQEIVRNAEPLIIEEPLKPWLTLKRNIKNVKYLPSMVDISFKSRYVYVDVGARSYGSSIGSWFKKQYPKQNKTFEVYAIEADKSFHQEYGLKKGVTLLPYAAWVKNETLTFEINGDPRQKVQDKGRGMGRIQPLQSSGDFDGEVDKIQGFDFANWLKSIVSEKDFVVIKMDVEGTEFDLIPKLFETGAICLVDEIFLECHYNRWQRCCPGQRSPKYEKTYGQCLELFTSLRKSGVLVHQWW
ncbi:Methyltransferase [Quillaja saponaria]|uniref:Methyltransferase n=1 Tax=Quillaja saponaria TaxID=32244 RepID=A0AAD7PME9_QUISA|nr:Methyltransferase [Quillaja saponaria]KAJ7961152.1 Methyltransferase [Quillaja saponaria]